jgi:hypothetical protein
MDTVIYGNGPVLTSKYYVPGLGYSSASGPAVGGGLGMPASPLIYSSTFFGSDVKGLLPSMFGKKGRRGPRKSTRRGPRKGSHRGPRKSTRRGSRRASRKSARRRFGNGIRDQLYKLQNKLNNRNYTLNKDILLTTDVTENEKKFMDATGEINIENIRTYLSNNNNNVQQAIQSYYDYALKN